MENKILKHKFLFISIIILLCLFNFFITSVKAVDVSSDMISKSESIAGLNDFCIASEGDGSVVWLFVFPSNTTRFFKSCDDNCFYVYLDDGNHGKIDCYRLQSDGTFQFVVTNYHLLNLFTFHYSTIDIMQGILGNDVFFQKTPVAVIPALETAEQIPEAITTTLKLIIPVSLIVLSIFFVIYLMRRLIYRSL